MNTAKRGDSGTFYSMALTVPFIDLLIVFPIGTIVFNGAVDAIGTIVIPVPVEAANNWFASAYGDPKMMVIWPPTYSS